MKGDWGAEDNQYPTSLPAGISSISVLRCVRSLRFGAVSELEIRLVSPTTTVGALRSFLSSVGHPVLGDEDGSRVKLKRKKMCIEAVGCSYDGLCAYTAASDCPKVSQVLDKEEKVFKLAFFAPEGQVVESEHIANCKREYMERYGVPEGGNA